MSGTVRSFFFVTPFLTQSTAVWSKRPVAYITSGTVVRCQSLDQWCHRLPYGENAFRKSVVGLGAAGQILFAGPPPQTPWVNIGPEQKCDRCEREEHQFSTSKKGEGEYCFSHIKGKGWHRPLHWTRRCRWGTSSSWPLEHRESQVKLRYIHLTFLKRLFT